MDDHYKQNLKSKLLKIQKVKSELLYLGTKDAWQYLKEVELVEKKPQELSDRINSRLSQTNMYQASPERLEAISSVFVRGYQVEHDFYDSIPEEQEAAYKNLFNVCMEFSTLQYNDEKNPKSMLWEDNMIRSLAVIFEQANKYGVKTDKRFFNFLKEQYIPSLMPSLSIPNLFKIQSDIGEFFSFKKNHDDFKSFQIDFDSNWLLTAAKIVSNLQRDHLDHRWEYRKQILDLIVPQRIKYCDANADSVEIYSSFIANQERFLSVCISIDEVFTEKFVRLLFGAEKSYVMKLIREYKAQN